MRQSHASDCELQYSKRLRASLIGNLSAEGRRNRKIKFTVKKKKYCKACSLAHISLLSATLAMVHRSTDNATGSGTVNDFMIAQE